jgi:L-ascorbate metabolism protein UlaG (beta-lactamase superfamily)
MQIVWLGHAAFLIISADGRRILTDPYESGSYDGALTYKPITEQADIVTASHDHADHFSPRAVHGNPQIINTPGVHQAAGLTIKGIASFHDPSAGAQRGTNIIFIFNVDGITIGHFGDLGHRLSDDDISAIGTIDVALMPVGGYYTIDAAEATELIARMAPRIVIPMHFRTECCQFPIAPVDVFLTGKRNVERLRTSQLSVVPSDLPAETRIKVLEHKL